MGIGVLAVFLKELYRKVGAEGGVVLWVNAWGEIGIMDAVNAGEWTIVLIN